MNYVKNSEIHSVSAVDPNEIAENSKERDPHVTNKHLSKNLTPVVKKLQRNIRAPQSVN